MKGNMYIAALVIEHELPKTWLGRLIERVLGK